jgi:gamma-glutamyltranspeptidase/glutathione hydrolase
VNNVDSPSIQESADTNRVGRKAPSTGRRAVCSSQHPIVTDTMLDIMRRGGNAVDAAIAGCLVQATVQQEMTNHAGTVTFLYWDAASGRTYELNSWGTIVPGLEPFKPVPGGKGLYTANAVPMAVIPGFMPGLKAMFERFATRPWHELCEPAVRVAEKGHEVDSFEHFVTAQTVGIYLHTASGRSHFTPGGYLPQVGERWRKPELAQTLRALADEGPDHFITGAWARQFVERANELGWQIELEHMNAIPPRWGEGLRYSHRGYEIVQLSPPESLGAICALALGILDALDVAALGHYTESAEALYYVAHTLRRANQEGAFLHDPAIFQDPSETLLSSSFHGHLADILRKSRPKIDLTEHVRVSAGKAAIAAATPPTQALGSCELSLVDPQGNWAQMLHTLQTGGIPGEVVGGVPMIGSHAQPSLASAMAGWFTGSGRIRGIVGHTFVLKDGEPVWSLGTPGFPPWSVPQVLVNRLHYGLGHYEAEDAPRMRPLTDEYKLQIESRIPRRVVSDLAKLGILVDPLPPYDWELGSFQMSWRDSDGTLHSAAGPRRAGSAAGY